MYSGSKSCATVERGPKMRTPAASSWRLNGLKRLKSAVSTTHLRPLLTDLKSMMLTEPSGSCSLWGACPRGLAFVGNKHVLPVG